MPTVECDLVPECHSFHLADGTKDVMLPLPLEPLEKNEGYQSNSHSKAPPVFLSPGTTHGYSGRVSLNSFA